MVSFQPTGRRERIFLGTHLHAVGTPVIIGGRAAALALLQDLGRDPWGRATLRLLYAEVVGRAAIYGESDRAMLEGLARRLVTRELKAWSVPLPGIQVPAGSLLPTPEAPAPAAPPPQKKKDAWVEVVLLDEGNPPRPVGGVKYRVEASDGSVIEGKLDDDGWARIGGLEEGDVKISFPELDADAWN